MRVLVSAHLKLLLGGQPLAKTQETRVLSCLLAAPTKQYPALEVNPVLIPRAPS